jgi:hypothetical protein
MGGEGGISMKALCIAFLLVGFVLFAPACIEDKCKNPKMTEDERGNKGIAVKCNAVVVCHYGGRPPSKDVLDPLVDPTITNQGTSSSNKELCVNRMQRKLAGQYSQQHCELEVAPEVICLDAQGAPDGSGPDVGGPTGGTLVTVGVGSGDYYLQPEGEGGAGGFRSVPSADESGGS